MTAILAWLARPIGKFASIAFGFLALWSAFLINNFNQRQKGAAGAITEMKEATHHATNQGRRAADSSRADGVRGKIDPGYRN
jgi:hypothetical protein